MNQPEKGSVSTGTAVSATTSATQILAANPHRQSARIYNNGSQAIFIGDATVTAATGMPLYPGQTMRDTISQGEWYGIVAAGTCSALRQEVD